MSMPKTAMHKDNRTILRQQKVGASRQIATMNSETIAKAMNQLTNDKFRARVLRVNSRHQARTAGRRESINHGLVCGYEVRARSSSWANDAQCVVVAFPQ